MKKIVTTLLTFFATDLVLVANDSDEDGVSDELEVYQNTDPNDPADFKEFGKGVVAFYSFDGRFTDISGNGNHLANNGVDFAEDQNGLQNESARFRSNGETPPSTNFNNSFGGAWLSFGSNNPLEGLSNWSISMWIKPEDFLEPAFGNAAASFIFVQERVVSVNINANVDKLGLLVGNGSRFYSSAVGVENGQDGFEENGPWVHLVATGEGSVMKLYSNGEEVSTMNGIGPVGENGNIAGIGAYFDGLISQFSIHNRALSADEVRLTYLFESGDPLEPALPELNINSFYESLPDENIRIDATPVGGFPTQFTYQWYFNEFKIPTAVGGTESSVTLTGVSADEGTWRVEVSNTEGSTEHTFEYRVFTDADGDGLSDGRESLVIGSNPDLIDTDSDGLSDFLEWTTYNTNPLVSDTDGDGFDDSFEINTGFDPTLNTSTPEAFSELLIAVEFRFNAADGVTYRIESSTDLENWSIVESGITGTGEQVTRFYSIEATPKRHFRSRRE